MYVIFQEKNNSMKWEYKEVKDWKITQFIGWVTHGLKQCCQKWRIKSRQILENSNERNQKSC